MRMVSNGVYITVQLRMSCALVQPPDEKRTAAYVRRRDSAQPIPQTLSRSHDQRSQLRDRRCHRRSSRCMCRCRRWRQSAKPKAQSQKHEAEGRTQDERKAKSKMPKARSRSRTWPNSHAILASAYMPSMSMVLSHAWPPVHHRNRPRPPHTEVPSIRKSLAYGRSLDRIIGHGPRSHANTHARAKRRTALDMNMSQRRNQEDDTARRQTSTANCLDIHGQHRASNTRSTHDSKKGNASMRREGSERQRAYGATDTSARP